MFMPGGENQDDGQRDADDDLRDRRVAAGSLNFLFAYKGNINWNFHIWCFQNFSNKLL